MSEQVSSDDDVCLHTACASMVYDAARCWPVAREGRPQWALPPHAIHPSVYLSLSEWSRRRAIGAVRKVYVDVE